MSDQAIVLMLWEVGLAIAGCGCAQRTTDGQKRSGIPYPVQSGMSLDSGSFKVAKIFLGPPIDQEAEVLELTDDRCVALEVRHKRLKITL